jgi:hypothetical protein
VGILDTTTTSAINSAATTTTEMTNFRMISAIEGQQLQLYRFSVSADRSLLPK